MFARLKSARGGNLLLELLMLVVGINIALWFEGKFEDFRDTQAELQYLEGLADDLRTDVENLDLVIGQNKAKVSRLEEILPRLPGLADASDEEQAATIFEASSYSFFDPSDFTYTSMQESGDFRLLSEPAVKEEILRLIRRYREIDTLQGNFIQAMDDGYIPVMMSKFDLLEKRIEDPSILDDLGFRNFFVFTLQDTGNRLWSYEEASKQAAGLLGMIEQRLGRP
jgi:hypothetical protein